MTDKTVAESIRNSSDWFLMLAEWWHARLGNADDVVRIDKMLGENYEPR